MKPQAYRSSPDPAIQFAVGLAIFFLLIAALVLAVNIAEAFAEAITQWLP